MGETKKVFAVRSIAVAIAVLASVFVYAGMVGSAGATTYSAKKSGISFEASYNRNNKIQSFVVTYELRCSNGIFGGGIGERRSQGWKPMRLPNGRIGAVKEISSDEDNGRTGVSFKLKHGKVFGTFFFYDHVSPSAAGDDLPADDYKCWSGRSFSDPGVRFVAEKK